MERKINKHEDAVAIYFKVGFIDVSKNPCYFSSGSCQPPILKHVKKC